MITYSHQSSKVIPSNIILVSIGKSVERFPVCIREEILRKDIGLE